MEKEIKNLTDIELLRIVNPSLAVMVGEYSVPELLNVAEEEIMALKGIGEAKAKVVLALKEIANRMIHRAKDSITSINSPDEAMEYFKFLAGKATEEVWVLLLDAKNHIIRSSRVTKGTLTGSPVGIREIFASAIKHMAAGIVVAHNHPSGVALASQEDIKFTKNLVESANILGIPVVDNLIIAKEGSLSLRASHSELFSTDREIF